MRCASCDAGEFGLPVVLKADGLAAGKGVVIAEDRARAEAAVARGDDASGSSARPATRLVIEECLTGPEVSFFVICDGTRALPIGIGAGSQAHLRRRSRAEHGRHGRVRAEPAGRRRARRRGSCARSSNPVIAGMAAEGHPFRGFLYVGLMLTADGPKVIEFNVRLGDPEAQVILPLIDEPLLPLLVAAAAGRLRASQRPHRPTAASPASCWRRAAIRSRRSPGSRSAGVDGAEAIPGVTVYHAGTARSDGAHRHRRRPRADRRRPRRRFRGSDRARLRRRAPDLVRRHAVPARHRPESARHLELDRRLR